MNRTLLVCIGLLSVYWSGIASRRSASSTADTETAPSAQACNSLSAYGGRLWGQDMGEWGGRIAFTDSKGKSYDLVQANSRCILRTATGVYAFTGLNHLSPAGAIYRVTQERSEKVTVKLLKELIGAPSNFHVDSADTVHFDIDLRAVNLVTGKVVGSHTCYAFDVREVISEESCPTR